MKYTCPYINSGISFEPKWVRPCHSNVMGPLFYEVAKKAKLNLDLATIEKKRQEIINQFETGELPDSCKNCFNLKKVENLEDVQHNKIGSIYITNWRHCNCNCIYCVHEGSDRGKRSNWVKKSEYYDLLPAIKYLDKNGLIGENPFVCITGGEPAVLKELPKIVDILLPYVKDSKFLIFSSGVRYSKTFEKLLIQDKCEIVISLDCSDKDLYKKIKRCSYFENVVSNIKKYIKITPNAKKRIILKYILINNINDNKDELGKFINLAKDIGLEEVQLDIDHRNQPHNYNSFPDFYYELYEYFYSEAEKLQIRVRETPQNKQIREKGKVF